MARAFALLDHKCPELEKMLEDKKVSYEWFVCGCSPCERQYQILEGGEWKNIDQCPFCGASMTSHILIGGSLMGPRSYLQGDVDFNLLHVRTHKEIECPACGHKFEVRR